MLPNSTSVRACVRARTHVNAYNFYICTFANTFCLHQVLAETEEAQICILRNMYALWKNHYQMMVVLTDKFLKTGIIECSAIANWIFSKEMASEFTKFVYYLTSLLLYCYNMFIHLLLFSKYSPKYFIDIYRRSMLLIRV